MRRRTVNVFGLSFLDVMFCGFGSVILLVMIVNADALAKRNELYTDLRGEVARIEREVLVGEQYLVELRSNLDRTRRGHAALQSAAAAVRTQTQTLTTALATLQQDTAERRTNIEALRSRLQALEQETKRISDISTPQREQGDKVRPFLGQGDRQYLTGLKLGGKRIVILVDASASMLDETIVNVLRRRNMSAADKRSAKKWQHALATVSWLVSQLPPASKFQLYTFNTEVHAAVEESAGQWLDVGDPQRLEKMIQALQRVVPANGTSLVRAFKSAGALKPHPDNLILLTDGLPTQGESKPTGTKVSGKERLRLFQQAVRALPTKLPVNIILYPMEGDPMAASAFWKLAGTTKGSLISPSDDWP
jgi:hypothetical protein